MSFSMNDYDWEADRKKSDEVRAKFPMFARVPHFECAAGWNGIIERLLTELVGIIPPEMHSQSEVRQIKEKFGGLRFYYWFKIGDSPLISPEEAARLAEIEERISVAVFVAESRSDRTCDICGAPGLHRTRGGWHVTRCEEHAEGAVPKPSAEEQLAFTPEMRRGDGTRYAYDRATDTVRVIPSSGGGGDAQPD